MTSAIGGTTISAGIADSQAQLGQALGTASGFGTDSVSQAAAAYRASGGGPVLAFLGFNPFQILATGAFHDLYWSLVVIFLGITAVIAMHRALAGRQSLSLRHPLATVAQVYFRLLFGVLIISNTPTVYGLLMTLNGALSQGVQAMASQSMTTLLQTGSMGTLTFAQARIEAIRSAAERRAIALYPQGASRAEMEEIGAWYVATAATVNAALTAQNLPGQLPALDSSVWTNTQTPDDRVATYVGRAVVRNFGLLIADLGALPAASGPLAISYPDGGSSSLATLSSALASDDAEAAQALAMPDTPSSDGEFEAARELYSKSVLSDTLAYLDTQLLPVIGASPTLAERVKAWFSEKVEQAAAAAEGFLSEWRAAVDWIGRAVGVALTRMVAFFFTAATAAMIEVELFMLVLAMPLWLLPATEDAFYGVVRSLLSLSVAVPSYQFIMLFVDALMGLVLKYILFGPLAAGGSAASGAAYGVTAAIAIVGSGGEVVALAMFCYLFAYLFLAVYVAMKTPKLVAVFLKGAGAAGAFLSTFATGLISGATAALATAAVAGGGAGTAGRFLSSGAGGRIAATREPWRAAVAPASATVPAPARPSRRHREPEAPGQSGPAAHAPAPGPAIAPRAVEAAGFGLRTFAACLQATSPADGATTALRALEAHRKRKEKEAEARHKSRQKAGH